jgi:membrane AbrB-like protein
VTERREARRATAILAGRILLAVGIGVAGGALFRWLSMPLPWMLGAMTATTLAALGGLPVTAPRRMRAPVVVVIGVMLGSSFTPELAARFGEWGISLAFLVLYIAASALLAVPYYRYVAGFDWRTAYFSGMPGGLNEMIIFGREMGGDERMIALVHASRVFVVVCVIALWFRVVAGHELGDRSLFGVPFAAVPGHELLILAACGVIGALVGHPLRLPAPLLVGPMLVSALVHLVGLSHSPPPSELVVLAQIMLGTVLGCRFVGVEPGELGRALVLSLGATAIVLGVSLGFVSGFGALFGQAREQVLLAYAPGGLAEMSLVALAMQADVAYVATHHTFRIAIVILFAPLVFRLLAGPTPSRRE